MDAVKMAAYNGFGAGCLFGLLFGLFLGSLIIISSTLASVLMSLIFVVGIAIFLWLTGIEGKWLAERVQKKLSK